MVISHCVLTWSPAYLLIIEHNSTTHLILWLLLMTNLSNSYRRYNSVYGSTRRRRNEGRGRGLRGKGGGGA